MRKIFITGNNGQLGRELTRLLSDDEVIGYDLPELDISQYEPTRALIKEVRPDVVINCAAMTNVDGCETMEEEAYLANAEGPKNLGRITKDLDIPFVHISTDYVFDGEGIQGENGLRPYTEDDTPGPVSVYGKSKLLGEEGTKVNPKHFILRTAWLYGDGHNFIKTMRALSKNHDVVTVVDDQYGSPTSSVDLAQAVVDLIETENYGTYHATNQGVCSWADLAEEVLKDTSTEVKRVTSEEYEKIAGKTVAPRPKWSVLENKHLQDVGLDSFRDWKDSVHEYLEKLDKEEL